jgi:hypothetical protein
MIFFKGALAVIAGLYFNFRIHIRIPISTLQNVIYSEMSEKNLNFYTYFYIRVQTAPCL